MRSTQPNSTPESRTTLADSKATVTLLASTLDRDRDEGFKRVFEFYDRPVLAFFSNRGCSREEAYDLTQETFVRVYRGLPGYRDRGKFDSWLFSIAANVWRGYLRDRSRLKRDGEMVSLTQETEPVSLDPDRDSENIPGPLHGVLLKERIQQLRIALDELPEQMKTCVLFRVDHELKYREIAVLMKISVDTVRSHLFKARERLKQRLGDYFSGIDL